ncbi:hypothetical protein ETAA8_00200 [Anatilimnocola aggregata]|uniref:Uncharacterized protein n=1 Tax=Anatilimnocola aggregata TaxID=2528021 RepID=A0A517Y3Y4_9BACT|nr:hypothetical protein ETAA8_00200 [Anatilimnocola aggregata]
MKRPALSLGKLPGDGQLPLDVGSSQLGGGFDFDEVLRTAVELDQEVRHDVRSAPWERRFTERRSGE